MWLPPKLALLLVDFNTFFFLSHVFFHPHAYRFGALWITTVVVYILLLCLPCFIPVIIGCANPTSNFRRSKERATNLILVAPTICTQVDIITDPSIDGKTQ
jgi:hypothetical protein